MKLLKLSLVFVVFALLTACSGGNSKEDLLVGKWQLSNYTDNGQRNIQQQAEFQQNVANMRITLEFFDNGEFNRSMLQTGMQVPLVSEGIWYLENEDQILTMEVDQAPKSKVLLVELSETKFTFQLEEEGISTTLSFVRR